jgi:hypothetical protein
MSKNYFAIEKNGTCLYPMVLADRDGNIAFEEFLYMTYDEMKSSDRLTDFVIAATEASDRKVEADNDHVFIVLIGEDGNFIWGILAGSDFDGVHRYNVIDFKKDGKHYRYAP